MCCFKICDRLVFGLCMVTPLFCAAQETTAGDEISYVSFAVPGALGTYPMSINASTVITGYYTISPTATGGFLRDEDGTITTFSVRDGVQTVPESINDTGEITGFYEGVAGDPHGFLREPNGEIITFDPRCSTIFNYGFCANSVPVTINAFGVIAGNHPQAPGEASAGFTRSRTGVLTSTAYSAEMHDLPTYITGLNASGATVGHFTGTVFYTDYSDVTSFLLHPSGSVTKFSVPWDEGYSSESTVAESINDDGVIAGWYSACFYDCADILSGGFVRSPEGEFTLFNPPGPIVTAPEAPALFFEGDPYTEPHRLSINGQGFITGSYNDANGVTHGFVRNPYGTITSFDPPEGQTTTATSINDHGVIAGSYYFYRNNKNAQAFLRFPRP